MCGDSNPRHEGVGTSLVETPTGGRRGNGERSERKRGREYLTLPRDNWERKLEIFCRVSRRCVKELTSGVRGRSLNADIRSYFYSVISSYDFTPSHFRCLYFAVEPFDSESITPLVKG